MGNLKEKNQGSIIPFHPVIDLRCQGSVFPSNPDSLGSDNAGESGNRRSGPATQAWPSYNTPIYEFQLKKKNYAAEKWGTYITNSIWCVRVSIIPCQHSSPKPKNYVTSRRKDDDLHM